MKCRVAVYLVAIGFLFGRVAFGATELIGNGGFESVSNAPWVFGGDLNSVPVISSPALAHSGNNFLSLGNVNGITNQDVYQTVTIPTNCILALYTYYFDATSVSPGDPANSVQFDSLVVTPNNGNSTILDEEFNSSFSYQQATYDLTAFAGKTIQVGFLVQQLQAGIGVRSSWGIDDVSLLAFTAADIPSNDYFTNSASLGMATNVSVTATNILATKEPGEPKITGNNPAHSLWWNWTAPSNGVVTIDTSGSTFDTVLAAYTGASVSNLTQVAANDNASGRGVTSLVKFPAATGTQYQISVDGKSGASGTIQLNLSFVPDTKLPTVTISSPKSGAKLTNSTVVVQGKASDNLAVALVQYRLENADGTNDYQDADGTNTWSATVSSLIPGPNTIRVRAFDTSGNESATAAITVTYTVVSPITVSVTSGSGTISPDLNGQLLDVGNTYTMTAKPAAGQVFSNWTGSIIATTPKLTFTMQSNMVLNANFVPNPFIPVSGLYQGLIYDTNNVAHQSSGFFNATVTSSGSFSAKLVLAGNKYSMSGVFSAGGFSSNNIVRKGLTSVSAQLHLDMSGGGITGEFSDGVWTAELNGARAASSPVTQAGHYTLLIPGGADGVNQPGGDSYGTIILGPTGTIAFKGVLADGTKVTEKANLLTTGQMPFYVPLYSGHGSILGWLTFSNGANSDITGTVDWFKPAGSPGKLYPAGFTNSTEAAGSSYQFTKGVPALNFSAGEVWLANGNLSSAFTNQVTLDSSSKVANQSSNKLTLTIATSTGMFKGSGVDPVSGKALNFTGVLLQKQNFGGGFFTGTDQAGRVFFGQQSP